MMQKIFYLLALASICAPQKLSAFEKSSSQFGALEQKDEEQEFGALGQKDEGQEFGALGQKDEEQEFGALGQKDAQKGNALEQELPPTASPEIIDKNYIIKYKNAINAYKEYKKELKNIMLSGNFKEGYPLFPKALSEVSDAMKKHILTFILTYIVREDGKIFPLKNLNFVDQIKHLGKKYISVESLIDEMTSLKAFNELRKNGYLSDESQKIEDDLMGYVRRNHNNAYRLISKSHFKKMKDQGGFNDEKNSIFNDFMEKDNNLSKEKVQLIPDLNHGQIEANRDEYEGLNNFGAAAASSDEKGPENKSQGMIRS